VTLQASVKARQSGLGGGKRRREVSKVSPLGEAGTWRGGEGLERVKLHFGKPTDCEKTPQEQSCGVFRRYSMLMI